MRHCSGKVRWRDRPAKGDDRGASSIARRASRAIVLNTSPLNLRLDSSLHNGACDRELSSRSIRAVTYHALYPPPVACAAPSGRDAREHIRWNRYLHGQYLTSGSRSSTPTAECKSGLGLLLKLDGKECGLQKQHGRQDESNREKSGESG